MLVSRHTRRRPRAPGGCVLLTWSFALQASWYGEQHVVCGRCRRHRFLLCAVRLLQRPIQHIRELVILPGRTQNRGREASLRQRCLSPQFRRVGVLLALRGTGANTCAYDPITLQNNKNFSHKTLHAAAATRRRKSVEHCAKTHLLEIIH